VAATSQGSAGGEAAAEDWIDYDWFRRLNAVAYAWQRAHSGTEMTLDQFYQFVDQVSPLLMDNQALSVWMQAQPITHYGNPPGTYIGAFPTTVTNPSFVEIVVYTLDAGNPPQESMHVGQVDGSYTAYNYRGETLTSGDFQATNGHGLIYTQDLCSAGGGAYRVVLQANIESTLRTAQTAFLCASQDLTTDPDAGVGLILMDPDGTLFNGTITSGNSAVIYNAGGGAVVQPNDVSTLPMTIGLGFHPSSATSALLAARPVTASLTLYLPVILRDWPPPADDWYYNLPLPFSRVIVATRPSQ
jgi:hypothetical protein